MILRRWLLISAFTLTTTASAGEAVPSTGTAATDVAQLLFALERAWVEAESQRDAAALDRILDREFIATFGSRAPLRKDDCIKVMTKSGFGPAASHTPSDRTVVVHGDTAIVGGGRSDNRRSAITSWN
jgi:hypothetical protein